MWLISLSGGRTLALAISIQIDFITYTYQLFPLDAFLRYYVMINTDKWGSYSTPSTRLGEPSIYAIKWALSTVGSKTWKLTWKKTEDIQTRLDTSRFLVQSNSLDYIILSHRTTLPEGREWCSPRRIGRDGRSIHPWGTLVSDMVHHAKTRQ